MQGIDSEEIRPFLPRFKKQLDYLLDIYFMCKWVK